MLSRKFKAIHAADEDVGRRPFGVVLLMHNALYHKVDSSIWNFNFARSNLALRTDPNRHSCWHIYLGNVAIGHIGKRVGAPFIRPMAGA